MYPADLDLNAVGGPSDEYDGPAAVDDDEDQEQPAALTTQQQQGGDDMYESHGDYDADAAAAVDDDVLDPSELEMLQEEAERMKGIGNRHMANQEFTRAYNAYSAALKLSPVGPSSHVFLSNRAAALLSLRKYRDAATDARRAIALAPTFSKAHARLGQALYFQRDYTGAVQAYEDAVKYEPNNEVTRSYLKKALEKDAKAKLRGQHPQSPYDGGDDPDGDGELAAESMSVLSRSGDTFGGNVSVVSSDPNAASHAVVSPSGNAGARISSQRIDAVVGSEFRRSAASLEGAGSEGPEDEAEGYGQQYGQQMAVFDDGQDPDFDEAARLQQLAQNDLANKKYKSAVETYSASLFLCPDDVLLSPQLHIGRAHALNGLMRHESAAIDARLAIRISPGSSEAYSALAKSLFYAGEYENAIEAFEKSSSLLAPGEGVSVFDQAYLEKARECLEEEAHAEEETGEISPRKAMQQRTSNKAVPKLRPPRFVSRQEAVESPPKLPAMPKAWPQQSVGSASSTISVGPERSVVFYSESLGIRLNRGPHDGMVRIVSIKETEPSSPIARKGHIELGDVVREVAGVDLRRPVTGVMWSDTVALIKICNRPLEMVLAKELSPPPASFLDELAKASADRPIKVDQIDSDDDFEEQLDTSHVSLKMEV